MYAAFRTAIKGGSQRLSDPAVLVGSSDSGDTPGSESTSDFPRQPSQLPLDMFEKDGGQWRQNEAGRERLTMKWRCGRFNPAGVALAAAAVFPAIAV